MSSAFKGLIMTFGMFTTIPMPRIWDDRGTKFMMPWFPVVGLLIGAIWWIVAEFLMFHSSTAFLVPRQIRPGVLLIVPFVFTGLIHLDGFMDTSDAILSRRSLEDKLRILKDPNTGAFAVIMVVFLLIMQFAALDSIMQGNISTFTGERILLLPHSLARRMDHMLSFLIVIPVVSRICSALSMMCIRPLKEEGYANVFRPTNAMVYMIIMPILLILFLFLQAVLIAHWAGFIVAGAVAFGYGLAMLIALKSFKFKGISGDLAGFALVIAELCGLFALATVLVS